MPALPKEKPDLHAKLNESPHRPGVYVMRDRLHRILYVGKARDLRKRGDDLRLACHRAVTAAAGQALPLAADLARRAARLQAVAPKLRAKGDARAVEMFLTRDALAPSVLAGFMSDRAARRLCDRLGVLISMQK